MNKSHKYRAVQGRTGTVHIVDSEHHNDGLRLVCGRPKSGVNIGAHNKAAEVLNEYDRDLCGHCFSYMVAQRVYDRTGV